MSYFVRVLHAFSLSCQVSMLVLVCPLLRACTVVFAFATMLRAMSWKKLAPQQVERGLLAYGGVHSTCHHIWPLVAPMLSWGPSHRRSLPLNCGCGYCMGYDRLGATNPARKGG